MTKAAIGGTFNVLHRGHKALFERACSLADELVVGLVSDEMARTTRKEVHPYTVRRRELEGYLNSLNKRYQIFKIDDIFGPAASMEDLDILVVSENSSKNGKLVNGARRMKGLKELRIEVVPNVIAEDFLPISSTRILKGEIDRDGRLLVPLRVNVGSANEVKISAVETVLKPLYGMVEVKSVDVPSGVPEEPINEEVLQGAINRAKAAICDAHLGIGIEAGLFWHEAVQLYLDVQFCAIIDAAGRLTVGHGPGFCYPPKIIDEVKKGKPVGRAMEELTGIESIGRKNGSVGYLSKGLIDRKRLTELAVLMAFIPRMRPDLYLHGMPSEP
jgi:inosine/xanthosine triphosphatase